MSWRWKCALLVLVCAVHFFVLFAFDSKHRSSPADGSQRASARSITVYAIPVLSTVNARQDSREPNRIHAITSAAPSQASKPAAQPGEELLPPAFPSTNDPGTVLDVESFLTAEAVDETALPEEHFEEVLKQALPYGLEAVELEIWIDHTGNTVLVQCVDRDNCNETADGLQQLLGLHFKPAMKDGLPVSSRKHIYIRIDPVPTFGL
jgi:hypothetical protein